MKTSRPNVLIVDDHLDEGAHVRANELYAIGVECTALHPSDIDETHLERADLVLVDYQIDDWPTRDAGDKELSLQPLDGIALASVLRRHSIPRERNSPTAFAILTGKLDTLADPLPPTNREHILSSICGVEWVFSKTEPLLGERIKILAQSVRVLPQKWSEKGTEELSYLLKINKSRKNWRNPMIEDAMRCLPPVHELSNWSHGLAFIRWLSQRILPYPTFLLEPIHLAARLYVDAEQFSTLLCDDNSLLRKFFSPAEYAGILQNFSGPRWWRASIEALLWEKTKGNSFDRKTIHELLSNEAQQELQPSVPPVDAVICYDEHFQPLTTFASINEAVRIKPDDWPAYADDAWITIDQARDNDNLRSVVTPEDRAELSGINDE